MQSLDQALAKRMDDFKKRVEQVVTSGNNKIKSEFTFKQNESEKTYMQSFNEIRQIVLEKIMEIENKIGGNTTRIEVIESQIVEVGQKYEQFQELFANLIQEMQSASEGENEDGQSKQSSNRYNNNSSHPGQKYISPHEDGRGLYAASTQMSQSSPLKIEGDY